MIGAISGDTMRTLTYSLAQPRPNGLQGSRWAFTSPKDVSWSRVHSFAFFMLGEPVRRSPMPSIRPLAISMILELWKPSYRMRLMVSRSTFSWANALLIPRVKNADRRMTAKRRKAFIRTPWIMCYRGQKSVNPALAGVKPIINQKYTRYLWAGSVRKIRNKLIAKPVKAAKTATGAAAL